jgi:hypothetical protein
LACDKPGSGSIDRGLDMSVCAEACVRDGGRGAPVVIHRRRRNPCSER